MKVSVRKAQGKQSNQTWLSLINNFVYNFLFLHVIYIEDIKKNILKLVKNKASQYSDIPIKIIKRTWTFLSKQ